MSANPELVTIAIDDAQRVSGLLQAPSRAHACYIMAHGAGAGMAHPFMASCTRINSAIACPSRGSMGALRFASRRWN